MIVYITKGTGVGGAVRYVMGEGRNDEDKVKELEPGHETRVTWMSGQGFGFAIDSPERVDLARKVMEWAALPENQASRTRKCEKDCFHASLSWEPGEEPTRAEMEQAARDYLAALGMENARAIFVAHSDTKHPHLHIVASRINPETGRTFSDQMDKTKSQAWALQYEREHGIIRCEAREKNGGLREAVEARDREKILDYLTDNSPTFDRKDLDRALQRGGMKDAAERDKYALELLAGHNVIGLRETADAPVTRYTTRDVLAAERQVMRDAKALYESSLHQVTGIDQHDTLSQHAHLDPEQRRAFYHLTRGDGLSIMAGEAGTGKSATLAAVRDAYEAAGCRVIGMAWTNAVVQDMQKEGFRNTTTIASELKRLEHGSSQWDRRTVLVVDEAAMLATKHLAAVMEKAREAGAKLILAGDDRQLTSIERGGMFGTLQREYGAAELHEVRRVSDGAQRKAFNQMHEGQFREALETFAERGDIHWRGTQEQTRDALVAAYARDTTQEPGKSRFVFAYTNADVAALNHDIRALRRERGELGPDRTLWTKDGPTQFAEGDRIQFTGTASTKAQREAGLSNGTVGTIKAIEGSRVTVTLDTKPGAEVRDLTFTVGDDRDLGEFNSFRHGYAGTIYKGQGRTLDQTYLCYSPHWRASSAYVALSRHRDRMTLFVAKAAAADISQLAKQMARRDERRAASHFVADRDLGPEAVPVRPQPRSSAPKATPARVARPVGAPERNPAQGRRAAPQATVTPAVGQAARAGGKILDGVAKATGSILDFIGNVFAPSPAPSAPAQEKEPQPMPPPEPPQQTPHAEAVRKEEQARAERVQALVNKYGVAPSPEMERDAELRPGRER